MNNTRTRTMSNHLGFLFMECMKNRPDAICQIDAATGAEETNASVLSRSVRLARCFRNFGLKPGDVLSIAGRNHLDLHIPFYAGLLNGLPITGVDPKFKFDEIHSSFKISRPKIAFCQDESHEIYVKVIDALGLDTKVITFDGSETSMDKFIETYDTKECIQDYKIPVEIDLDKTYAFLVSTSGTSGYVKLAAIKHQDMIAKINMFNKMTSVEDTRVMPCSLNLAPINWISGFYGAIGLPLMRQTKLQTSNPNDFEHSITDIINKYKPVNGMLGPTVISSLLNRKNDVDLSCFRCVSITGSKIFPDMKKEFQALLHEGAVVLDVYGMTETIGPCLAPNVKGPVGSCGRRLPCYEVKLVDPETGKEVLEPNVTGECWVKGIMFAGYYNDPEETARTRTEDGFYKTGDLLYRDENDNFYYLDRLKSLIKFRNYHILPVELEEVILTHPAVEAVCVCGVPDVSDGQRPAACVVTRDGCDVTTQQIKDLVASKLSKNKELSGGVYFLDELPMTSTGKMIRGKLLDVISKLQKE